MKRLFAITIIVLLALNVALATFSMRIRSSAEFIADELGGRIVSRNNAEYCGKEAKIYLIGFEKSAGEVASSISRLWQSPKLATGTSFTIDGSWLSRKHRDGTKEDIFLLPGNSSDTSSAFLVESSSDDTAPSFPEENPLPFELKTWLKNDTSSFSLFVYELASEPNHSISEAVIHLQGDGWEELLQSDGTAYLAKNGHLATLVSFKNGTQTRLILAKKE